jgi:conjugal transfer/type IV secretion protein DotA/TraY
MHDMNKKIIRYITLPQIMPRVRTFMSTGFSHVAMYMAFIYRAARLLPAGHPYLIPANRGRFGVRHVVAEAANNLTWDRKHIDQIFIFGLILVGIVIIGLQFAALLFSLGLQAAQAAMPTNYAEFFVTADPEWDIAFVLLDRVFGVPDIFNSCVMQGTPCYNTSIADVALPFHDALRAVFQYYSIGLLVVAVMIFVYFIGAIAVETAQTGTAFGKRFNHVWAPIRLVVALGLLVPLASGLNSAQYITLYAAKWGSGFATNGWLLFLDTIVTADRSLAAERERLVVTPGTPPVNELVIFFSAVSTCVRFERMMYPGKVIDAYVMNPNSTEILPRSLDGTSYAEVRDTYLGTSIRTETGPTTQYESTRILVYFGTNEDLQGGGTPVQQKGSVQSTEPTCGQLMMEITDVDEEGLPGSQSILEQYYILIQELWQAASGGGGGAAGMGDVIAQIGESMSLRYTPLVIKDEDAPLPSMDEMRATMTGYEDYVAAAIQNGVEAQETSDHWLTEYRRLGWAAAAVWYNQVAAINGALMGATYNLPTVYKYPRIMEQVMKARIAKSQSLQGRDRFRPYQGNNRPIRLNTELDVLMAEAMYWSTMHWENVGGESSGNFLIDFVKAIFGLDGLFDMRSSQEAQIHPLAQLVGIGKSIINRSIANLGDSFAGFMVAQGFKILDMQPFSTIATAIGGFQSSIAMMGLGIGFVLFYVVPFLPFIYFFFAVGAWIKTIFEAMVGVPLWALAHLRIDGNGLPGDAAMGGYYLILEIFLRPIIIIFALLGSITIFAAQVRVLHEIWELVVSNVSGLDRDQAAAAPAGVTGAIEWLRNPIDQFFYTIIYAIVVYMLGLSSFKMVDIIPQQVMRWMGHSANAFQDNGGEQAGQLMRNSMMSNQFLQGPLSNAAAGGGQAVNSVTDMIKGGKI